MEQERAEKERLREEEERRKRKLEAARIKRMLEAAFDGENDDIITLLEEVRIKIGIIHVLCFICRLEQCILNQENQL